MASVFGIAALLAVASVYCSGEIDSAFPSTGDPFIDQTIHDAINTVDRAIHETKRAILENPRPSSPGDLIRLFRFPSEEMIEVARSQEIFESVIEKLKDRDSDGMHRRDVDFEDQLTPDLLEQIAQLSGCSSLNQPVECEDMCYHAKYRTYDGTCNNLGKPNQGAALRPFARLLKAEYENDFNEPIGWNSEMTYGGNKKPSPRLVSTTVGSTSHVTDHEELTDLVSLWGQFLDHDVDLTPASPSSVSFKDGSKCSEICDNDPPCFPIPVPANDPRIDRECMEFTRSSAVCGTGSFSVYLDEVVPREQMNAITSYIDASQVYGSSESVADKLREFDKGAMKVGTAEGSRPFLPYDEDARMGCVSDDKSETVPCFMAGDVRANELIGLTSLHTLFIREHNRLAGILADLNPRWDDETIYQEVRKIIGALMQHISYDGYLPKVLGDATARRIQRVSGYNPDEDASVFNMFATAAYRYGHSTVKPILPRLGPDYQPIEQGNLPLRKVFFQPWRIVQEGGIDPILRGFFSTAAKDLTPDEIMSDELTEHLFELSNAIALDLMALNLQRGRDHGLPGYTKWRKKCRLSNAESFADLSDDITNKAIRDKLQHLYGSPDNVDLYIGALAEDPLPGSLLGPTFTCLLKRQFLALKEGDRFWYENEGVFTQDQVVELKKASLARVICDNTDITEVQADVFLMPGVDGDRVECSEIPEMDLSPWTDSNEDTTAPTITCPQDIESTKSGESITWDDPRVNDDSRDPVNVICSPSSGSEFSKGETTVSCSASDSSGNCASCEFSVTITEE